MENNVGKIEFNEAGKYKAALRAILPFLSSKGLSTIDDKIRDIISKALGD